MLALNAGSSSLKAAVFDAGGAAELLVRGEVERIGARRGRMRLEPGERGRPNQAERRFSSHRDAARELLAALDEATRGRALLAIGHRFVHGGARLTEPTLIDGSLLEELRRLALVDPDHAPQALEVLETSSALHAGVPQVACFDTAFHRTMPRPARLLPLPLELFDEGIRRYGFHGLSYESIVAELRAAGGGLPDRLVVAHLGAGASLAAIRAGRSIDTTMGFSPTGGVMMATRSGDLDPGVLLELARRGASAAELTELVNKRAGLLGVSGTSGDMRDLLERERSDPSAADAVELFCYQARKAVGALAAALGGLDALAFTGGIGEHSAPVRGRIAGELAHLGVELDPERNERGEAVVSSTRSRVVVRVLRTDEERVVARHALERARTATEAEHGGARR